MNRPLRLLLVLFSLLALVRPAACQNQNTDFKQLLSGSGVPLTLTLKDMDGGWRRLSLSTSSGAADPTQAYLALYIGGTTNTYYTKGDTVTVAGETFLIAYHRQIKIDLQALMKSGTDLPKVPTLTPDTPLSLFLMNLRSLSTLTDIQPFSLDQEISAANAPPDPPADADPAQTSLSNLKQIGLGLMQYVQDYDEKLPPMKSAAVAKKALSPYVKNDSVFQNPQTHEPYLPNTSLSGRSLATFERPSDMVIYYEASPAPDGTRSVVFLDGHVKRIPEAQWPALKAASHVPNAPPR